MDNTRYKIQMLTKIVKTLNQMSWHNLYTEDGLIVMYPWQRTSQTLTLVHREIKTHGLFSMLLRVQTLPTSTNTILGKDQRVYRIKALEKRHLKYIVTSVNIFSNVFSSLCNLYTWSCKETYESLTACIHTYAQKTESDCFMWMLPHIEWKQLSKTPR